jgi:hypothetical protein
MQTHEVDSMEGMQGLHIWVMRVIKRVNKGTWFEKWRGRDRGRSPAVLRRSYRCIDDRMSVLPQLIVLARS